MRSAPLSLRAGAMLLSGVMLLAACSGDPVRPSREADAPSLDVSAAIQVPWEAQLLPLLPGGTWAKATAINTRGVIVGYGDVAGGLVHAFVYANGSINDLGGAPGYPISQAFGINAQGEVVGTAVTSTRPGVRVAVRWSAAGQVTVLPGLNRVNNSEASAINDAGVVVGKVRVANGDWHAARWIGGSVEDLAGPWMGSNSGDNEARAINNAGEIVGFGDFASTFGLYVGLKWTSNTTVPPNILLPLNSPPLYADSSEVFDINNHGEWVGWSDYPIPGTPTGAYISSIRYDFYPPNGLIGPHEVAYSDRRRLVGTLRQSARVVRAFTSTTLWYANGSEHVLPLTSGFQTSVASDVNSCGRVVGWLENITNGARRAVLWRRWARGTNGRVFPCD